MEDYGLALKKLRKHFSLTQREVAERVGISNHAISKWENAINQPDISALRTICNGYGITTEQFFRIAAGEEVELVLNGPSAQVAEEIREEIAQAQAPALEIEQNSNSDGAGTRQTPNFLQKNSGILALVLSIFAVIFAAVAFFAFADKGDSSAASSIEENSVSQEKEKEFYAVQFHSGFDGSAIEMPPQIQTKGEAWALPAPEFRREGYEFVGWDYEMWNYAPGRTFTYLGEAEYCVFTARWRPIEYTLLIYSEIHGTTVTKRVTYDEDIPMGEIILNSFTYPYDYVFAGFAVHGVQYSPNDIVKNLALTDGGVVEVYAVWYTR